MLTVTVYLKKHNVHFAAASQKPSSGNTVDHDQEFWMNDMVQHLMVKIHPI